MTSEIPNDVLEIIQKLDSSDQGKYCVVVAVIYCFLSFMAFTNIVLMDFTIILFYRCFEKLHLQASGCDSSSHPRNGSRGGGGGGAIG